MATRTRTAPPPALGGVEVASSGSTDRTCAACHVDDQFPRHIVSGVRFETQIAQLPNGQSIEVQVPVDEAFHWDCHAKAGCEHCADMVEHNEGDDGRIDGESVSAPDHLLDIAPGEFNVTPRGALQRVMSKEEARTAHDEAMQEAGYEVIDHDEAHELHLRHAAGEVG